MDYGQIAVLKEFGPSDPSGGDVRWTARFGADNLLQSYRGFKTEWHATPSTVPDLVVVESNSSTGCTAGYVSWNGATDVEAWAVSEGPALDRLSPVGYVGYMGFETAFTVAEACVQVAAVVGRLQVAKSNVVCVDSL